MSDDKITMSDVMDAGYCATGARRWFTLHGLDFVEFMKNGLDRETLLATGDVMAEKVIATKDNQNG